MNHETEVKREAPELPEWTECQSMFADGSQTPLTEFIRAYEPVGPEAEQWRADFADLLATVRSEEREAAFRDVLMVAKANLKIGPTDPLDTGWNLALAELIAALEAAASGRGEMNG